MSTHNRRRWKQGGSCQATMYEQAQGGCGHSLDELMVRHEGLVQAAVRRQVLGELPFEEALQAGRMGLWRAILGYDVKRGTAFSTYAWPCIVRQVWRAVDQQRRSSQDTERGVWVQEAQGLDPAQDWERRMGEQALARLVQGLPERLRQVIVARYGLEDGQPHAYRPIGAQLGCSGEWARRLHEEALVWLRHPAHSQALRSWLDRHTFADYAWAEEKAEGWLRRRGGRHGR